LGRRENLTPKKRESAKASQKREPGTVANWPLPEKGGPPKGFKAPLRFPGGGEPNTVSTPLDKRTADRPINHPTGPQRHDATYSPKSTDALSTRQTTTPPKWIKPPHETRRKQGGTR